MWTQYKIKQGASHEKFITNIESDFFVRSRNKTLTSLENYRELYFNVPISISFNFYSLHYDESIKQDLSSYLLEGGSLNIGSGNGIRRKLSIDIFNKENWIPSPVMGFLWKGSKFKLEICIKSPRAENICAAGIFLLESFSMPHEFKKNRISLNLVDKFGGLDGTVGGKIADSIYIPRGARIKDIVIGLLNSERIEGEKYEVKSVIFPSEYAGSTTPCTITKSADSESNIGDLIKELVGFVNLNVFYDVHGRLRFSNMSDNMMTNSKPAIWEFSDNDAYYESPNMNANLQDVANVVVVQGANINGDIISAVIENKNPKSPTSIYNFEPTICKIVDENISSHILANKRAEYELFKKSLLPLSISFSTIIIPLIDVEDVINITDSYYKLRQARFIVNSISIPISSKSKMQLSITNLEEVALNVV